MGDLEDAIGALSGASALVFFNVPATLMVLRVLLAARRAHIPVIYEVDAAIFDPETFPPPLATFDGLLTPQLHDEMRVRSVQCQALARHCDYGLAVTEVVAEKLRKLVIGGRAHTLAKAYNPDPFIFPCAVKLPERFIFVRSPRFLSLADKPGSLGAAVLAALRDDGDLGLVTMGYVHLDEVFNAYDARVVELAFSAEPSTYRSIVAASALAVAPKCIDDDDGMAELIWLEAAELGIPTLLDGEIAEALGLKAGETCFTASPRGWTNALADALSDPARLRRIGRQALAHAGASRSLDKVAAQLMSALQRAASEQVAA